MKYWGPLLLQLLLSSLPWGPRALSQEMNCVQDHACICLLPRIHQVINLAAVGPLTIPLSLNKTGGYVQFSPCQPFSEPANLTTTDCVQVAACVTLSPTDSGDLHHIAYGRHYRSEFQYNSSTSVLTVMYPAWPSSSRKTVVHFNCSPLSTVAHISLLPEHLEVFIQTPCACPDHCQLWNSAPSFLIAVSFFVTLGIYLLWGICGLPAIHTNRRSQLMIQDQFWYSTCSSCLGKSEEDKENIPLMSLCSET